VFWNGLAFWNCCMKNGWWVWYQLFSFKCFEVGQLLISIWEKLVEVLVGVKHDLGQGFLLLFGRCCPQLSNGLVRQSNDVSPIIEKIVVVVTVAVVVVVVGRDCWSGCWLFGLLIHAVRCCCCCTIGRWWGSRISRRTWRRCWRGEARLILTQKWGWLGVDNRYRSHCLERKKFECHFYFFDAKKNSILSIRLTSRTEEPIFLSILSKHWSNSFFAKSFQRKKVESLTRGNWYWYYITATAWNKMTLHKNIAY